MVDGTVVFTQIFAVRVPVLLTSELRFSIPLKDTVFSIERLREYSKRLIDSFQEDDQSISASDFKLDQGDSLYEYSLVAKLFDDKVKLSLTCSEIKIKFLSVTKEAYLDEISDILKTLIDGLDFAPGNRVFVNWDAHAQFESEDVFKSVLAPKVAGFTYAGFAAIVEGDPSRVMFIGKIGVEKSFSYSNAIYATATLAGIAVENATDLQKIWAEIRSLLKPFEIDIVFQPKS